MKKALSAMAVWVLALCAPGLADPVPRIIPHPQEAEWIGPIGPVEGLSFVIVSPADYEPGAGHAAFRRTLSDAGAYHASQLPLAVEPDIVIFLADTPPDVPSAAQALEGKGPMDAVWLRYDMPGGEQGYILDIRKRNGKIRIVADAVGEQGILFAAQTLRQMLFPARDSRGGLWEARIADWPMFPLRGVIEGGGGHWEHEQRMRILEFMGTVKMNYFLYIPKGDSKVRREWRKPYADEEMARFKLEIDLAAANGIHFAYGANPALNFCASSDETFEALKAKFDRFMELGVDQFGVFFDDVLPARQCKADREAFDSAAQAQAHLANRLYEYLKQRNPNSYFFMCPTPYWTIADYGYFRDLRETLHEEIAVGWTGYGVAPHEIPLANAERFYEIVQRPIGLGDNYPVHGGKICMGTLRKRAPDLYRYIPSFVANPAWRRPTATSIPLSTIADYTWNPHGYDPDRSWSAAILRFAGHEWYDRIRAIAESYARAWPRFAIPSPLETARTELGSALAQGGPVDELLDRVEAELRRVDAAARQVEAGFPVESLVRELQSGNYFERLTDHAALGLENLAALRRALDSGDEAAVEAAVRDFEALKFDY